MRSVMAALGSWSIIAPAVFLSLVPTSLDHGNILLYQFLFLFELSFHNAVERRGPAGHDEAFPQEPILHRFAERFEGGQPGDRADRAHQRHVSGQIEARHFQRKLRRRNMVELGVTLFELIRLLRRQLHWSVVVDQKNAVLLQSE